MNLWENPERNYNYCKGTLWSWWKIDVTAPGISPWPFNLYQQTTKGVNSDCSCCDLASWISAYVVLFNQFITLFPTPTETAPFCHSFTQSPPDCSTDVHIKSQSERLVTGIWAQAYLPYQDFSLYRCHNNIITKYLAKWPRHSCFSTHISHWSSGPIPMSPTVNTCLYITSW